MAEPAGGSAPFLELAGVSKRYGGVRALEGVDFACRSGAIHAVLGENGAGKSTLIKIVSGVVRPDEGEIRLDGRPVTFPGPRAANRAGIVCIFQELSLMPDLSVADNVCIANPPRRLGLIDRRAQRRRAEELLARVGCEDVNPAERVKNLTLSRRQMVEIAKALGQDPRLLILDEATSALTSADVREGLPGPRRPQAAGPRDPLHLPPDARDRGPGGRLLGVQERPPHRDLREGRAHVGRDRPAHDRAGVGERLPGEAAAERPAGAAPRGRPAALGRPAERHLARGRQGRDRGLGGLDGQGQRELLLALFGVLAGVEGRVSVGGREVRPGGPADAKRPGVGMALIPEDRKTEGLMLPMTVAENLGMAALGRLGNGVMIDRRREREAVRAMIAKLQIKVGDPTTRSPPSRAATSRRWSSPSG